MTYRVKKKEKKKSTASVLVLLHVVQQQVIFRDVLLSDTRLIQVFFLCSLWLQLEQVVFLVLT